VILRFHFALAAWLLALMLWWLQPLFLLFLRHKCSQFSQLLIEFSCVEFAIPSGDREAPIDSRAAAIEDFPKKFALPG
jgi:hypothetical protein